jgi:hypothetical protein
MHPLIYKQVIAYLVLKYATEEVGIGLRSMFDAVVSFEASRQCDLR